MRVTLPATKRDDGVNCAANSLSRAIAYAAGHTHPMQQFMQCLFRRPPKQCEPLDFSGPGRIHPCMKCLLESPEWARGLTAVRAIAEAQRRA